MKTYQISEFKNHLFVKKMNKIAKKAKRLGIDFGYNLVGLDKELIKTKSGKELYYDMYTYEVYGESPTINGFVFLAKIEPFADGKNLVHTHNTEMDFSQYRDADNLTCEHCNTNRYRKFYYVIGEGENVKVVGHNCLANYIEMPNADKVADFYASFLVDEYTFMNDYNERDYTERGVGQEYTFPVDYFLTYVIAVISKYGYLSVKNENAELGKISTRSRVTNEWYYEGSDGFKPSPEEIEEAREMLQEAYALLEEKRNLNEYEYNVLSLIEHGYMKHNHIGYIASIPPLHFRLSGGESNKSESVPSEHMWNKGDKIEGVKATVTAIVQFNGAYGVGYTCKFDVDGNVAVWFASSRPSIEVGDEVTISKATVKGHDNYQGVKQTLITRVKFS